MMQTMRNSAKIIFFLVLLTFAGFMILQGLTSIFSKPKTGDKSAPPGVIGEIDGAPIPLDYFENAYRPQVRDLMQKTEEPSEEELKEIRDQIWNRLTTVTLLEQEAERRGIRVTNAEVVEYMKLSPPQDMQNMDQFKTDGKFDLQKYQDWLRQAAASSDPQIIQFLSNFEGQIRQQITLSRLQELVVSMTRVTPEEAKEEYLENNEKVKVKYIYIPNSDYRDSLAEVPEEELRAKYEEEKQKYKEPASATVSYVEFPKEPSDEDYDAARVVVDSIRQELVKGADFAEAAKEVSEDPGSGKKGGDLGWFREGQMVQPFWDAVTLLSIGQISEPVKTVFGWHIIKLTGKKEIPPDSLTTDSKYEYRASHILIKVEVSSETMSSIEVKANEFIRDATATGFDEAAKEIGLEVKESPKFTEDGYIAGIGNSPDIAKFAFSAKKNDISPIIYTRNSLLVCALPSVTPETFPPLDQVRERVKESYLFTKRIEEAYDHAVELSREFDAGKSFEQVADLAGKPVLETDFFTRHQFIPKVGNDPYFIGAAFNLTQQRPISKGVKARSGAYLLELIDREEPDTSFFSAHADSLIQASATEKRKTVWPQYVNYLKTNANIVDYRSYYYGG